MISVDAMGDACPIPVVKTKNAIKALRGPGAVETLVDNEIAVQNLMKMAGQKGYGAASEQLAPNRFKVTLTIDKLPEGAAAQSGEEENCTVTPEGDAARKNTVAVIASSKMGEGSDELGALLMKGFLYALSRLDEPPKTVLFYNGGASLTCADSPALEDLKSMQARGVEILTCGTCLHYYGITGRLAVGEITDMYTIAERMAQAQSILKP